MNMLECFQERELKVSVLEGLDRLDEQSAFIESDNGKHGTRK